MKRSAVQTRRLEKWRDWLREMRPTKARAFDMELVREEWKDDERHTCGTVACAIGWTPNIFPGDWKADSVGWNIVYCQKYPGIGIYEAAVEFFGLEMRQVKDICEANSYFENYTHEQITPKIVAKRIDSILKGKR